MDIASVYLNLASLLGTEIEVEGYYCILWQPRAVFLHRIEYEIESERLHLPPHFVRRGFIDTDQIHSIPTLEIERGLALSVKVFLKGVLTQNAHGEPLLSRITSISYKTHDAFFWSVITYRDNWMIWHKHTDLVFHWAGYFQALHKPIREITLASSILGAPILIEGYLWPRFHTQPQYEVTLMLAVEKIVLSAADLWRLGTLPSLSNVIHTLFGAQRSPTEEERSKPELATVAAYTKIGIPIGTQADAYLNHYFPERKHGDYRSTLTNTRFTFAGTIEVLDEAVCQAEGFTPDTRLVFTTVDYITAHQINISEYSEDDMM